MSVSAPVKLTIKDYKSELHNDWCPGCLRPETPIVMADGTRQPICDVPPFGHYLLTYVLRNVVHREVIVLGEMLGEDAFGHSECVFPDEQEPVLPMLSRVLPGTNLHVPSRLQLRLSSAHAIVHA